MQNSTTLIKNMFFMAKHHFRPWCKEKTSDSEELSNNHASLAKKQFLIGHLLMTMSQYCSYS